MAGAKALAMFFAWHFSGLVFGLPQRLCRLISPGMGRRQAEAPRATARARTLPETSRGSAGPCSCSAATGGTSQECIDRRVANILRRDGTPILCDRRFFASEAGGSRNRRTQFFPGIRPREDFSGSQFPHRQKRRSFLSLLAGAYFPVARSEPRKLCAGLSGAFHLRAIVRSAAMQILFRTTPDTGNFPIHRR